MSSTIKQAIEALKGRIADAYTAVATKGGTLPATQDSANLPTAIASIPSGASDPFDSFFPNYHNPLKMIKNNLDSTYKSGVCYEWLSGQVVSVEAPTCDRIIFADGSYIDNPSGTIYLKYDTDTQYATTYIVCLFTTDQAAVTSSFNTNTLLGFAAYNLAFSYAFNTSSSTLQIAMLDSCAVTVTQRSGLNTTAGLFYYDTGCTSYVVPQWANLFTKKCIYFHSEYDWQNIGSSGSEVFYAGGGYAPIFYVPNMTGNYWSTTYISFAAGTFYAPSMNAPLNPRNALCVNMIIGKVTFWDVWSLNTVGRLAYLEIGEDTDIDMNAKNSRLYLDYISTQGGIDMINANIVRGIGNKVKDNSGTGVTRVFTLPASVYAILTNETKAVFTNKGWTIAGA